MFCKIHPDRCINPDDDYTGIGFLDTLSCYESDAEVLLEFLNPGCSVVYYNWVLCKIEECKVGEEEVCAY
jgi:hypothetical protein